MASRTNKIGIAKKKKQLEKLRNKKVLGKRWLKNRNLSDEEKKEKGYIFEMVNPKGNKYIRDKSGRKVICIQTGLREDYDAYRLLFKANSNEVFYKYSGGNSRLRKKIKKNLK